MSTAPVAAVTPASAAPAAVVTFNLREVGLPGDSDDDAPQIAPVAHMAIGAFGVLDPEERKGLAEAAEGGDEGALWELRANHVEAIEAMPGALEDPASRKLVALGMTLALKVMPNAARQASELEADTKAQIQGNALNGSSSGDPLPSEELIENSLDMVQEQLQMQLEGFLESSPAIKDF